MNGIRGKRKHAYTTAVVKAMVSGLIHFERIDTDTLEAKSAPQ